MKKIFKILCLLFLVFTISCSKKIEKESFIKGANLNLQVLEAYEEGMKSLNDGDVLFAAKKFNEAEMLFPQSLWAPKSALMAAYAYYSQDYYIDAIAELQRFIRIYPKDKNIDYAYYLLAVSYYEQIIDETKDLESIINAKKYFEFILENYPNTEYALDSNFKLDLIQDILASKEMYVARYYFEKKKWIPAINRFKLVVDEYDTTIFVEEALHRLVEIYYIIGLTDESKKYANLLGSNYQSSDWYDKSYKLFNKNYKTKKEIKKAKKNNIIIKKFKSLINWDEKIKFNI